MATASTLLARGWWRGMRRWWIGTALVLALVQVLLLSVAGVFSGMEAATTERVEAFFTGDARVTKEAAGAAPAQYWNGSDVDRVAGLLAADGAVVEGRLESQFVLSRRTLLQAYLEEDEQYEVRPPGSAGTGTDFYGLGVIVGLPSDAPSLDDLRDYLLPGGRFPQAREDRVEIVMGSATFEEYVGDRRGFSTWPPPTAELEGIRFEITSGRVDPSGPVKDLVRMPARVVGLFDTGLDALDTFTLVGHRDSVALLLGMDPALQPVNAFVVHGTLPPDPPGPTEDADAFAQRYIGQMVDVVRALGLFLAVLFIALPLFLVWHGLAQLLQMHHREYAVCRAIGVGIPSLGLGMLVLVAAVTAAAVALTAGILVAVAATADPFLADLDLPLPVRFHVPPTSIFWTLGAVALAMGAALVAALERVRRQDLPAALRAP